MSKVQSICFRLHRMWALNRSSPVKIKNKFCNECIHFIVRRSIECVRLVNGQCVLRFVLASASQLSHSVSAGRLTHSVCQVITSQQANKPTTYSVAVSVPSIQICVRWAVVGRFLRRTMPLRRTNAHAGESGLCRTRFPASIHWKPAMPFRVRLQWVQYSSASGMAFVGLIKRIRAIIMIFMK